MAQYNQQQVNILLQMQYFFLYEQISHGLNHGDISHIESLFAPWMSIFCGCEKHKYITKLKHYLENFYFIFNLTTYIPLYPSTCVVAK